MCNALLKCTHVLLKGPHVPLEPALEQLECYGCHNGAPAKEAEVKVLQDSIQQVGLETALGWEQATCTHTSMKCTMETVTGTLCKQGTDTSNGSGAQNPFLQERIRSHIHPQAGTCMHLAQTNVGSAGCGYLPLVLLRTLAGAPATH